MDTYQRKLDLEELAASLQTSRMLLNCPLLNELETLKENKIRKISGLIKQMLKL